MQAPLSGCKVVELSHIMAGPVCGMMLADMGADVIKIERPAGDDTRRSLTPNISGESASFMMVNRNKRGLSLDLKHPEGKEILAQIIDTADIVVENYRTGSMEKLGFGYETLKKTNPGLIYCALSGFGRTGPYSERGGFDLIAQGMSGLMAITGEGEDRPPVKVGAPVTDITAGILGAMGILAAIIHRLKTGEGQKIDTSLFEAGITHTYWQSAIALAGNISPGALGSAHPLYAPYQAFKTRDGWINIGAANQANWERLCQLIEAPELVKHPHFADNDLRLSNLDELTQSLNSYLSRKNTAEWMAIFDEGNLPAGPVLSILEMLQNPQTLARDMLVETNHSRAGRVKSIGFPVKFSQSQGGVSRPAPLLGEHSRDILREQGFADNKIEQLIHDNIVIAS